MRLRFADCELDLGEMTLSKAGKPVPVEPQVFDLLRLFAEHPGELINRERIIETVWKGRIVSDAAVSSRINALRRAVGDDGKTQNTLQTVPRRGFRFLPAVQPTESSPAPASGGRQTIRMTTSFDGTALAYAVSGVGPPLMRAGHFLTHLHEDWENSVFGPTLDRFSSAFTLTRYDQRGTGLSDRDHIEYSLENMTSDLKAVADAAGMERFPIFASSQGVPLALKFAAENPDRVSRIACWGGFAQGRNRRGEEPQAEALMTMMREGWGRPGSPFATAFTTVFMPDASTEQIADMTRVQLASATAEAAIALRGSLDDIDITGLLGDVQAPVCLYHADGDAVHPSSQSKLMAALLPDAELNILTGRSHIPLPGTPAWENMMAGVVEFLKSSL